MSYLKRAARNVGTPPQSQPLDSRQVPNSAGGYAYPVTDWVSLDRFLVLGTEGGSYYAEEQTLTAKNAKAVERCIKEDGVRVVTRVVEISDAGRAPKNDPALFVLAMCAAAKDQKTRAAAYAAIPKVARIGTHLFHFGEYVNSMRGWSRGLRNAIARWYLDMDVKELQNQLVKYQARDGWSHANLLQLAHPHKASMGQPVHTALRWATGGVEGLNSRKVQKWARGQKETTKNFEYPNLSKDFSALPLIGAFEEAKKLGIDPKIMAATTDATERTRLLKNHVQAREKEISRIIDQFQLTHEMIPTEFKNSQMVWEALFAKMPMTAMIRNLANMTRVGLLAPLSSVSKEVVKRLKDADALKKARVHPIALLIGGRTYGCGHPLRGKGEPWTPVTQVVDAMDEAFYLAFGNVTPTGKNIYLGLDISGSMGGGDVAGIPGFTPREASCAMAMVTARTEPNWLIRGFTDGSAGGRAFSYSGYYNQKASMVPIDVSPKQRLSDVMTKTARLPMGGTDCALPMRDAKAEKLAIDAFIIYTDNETWAGDIHPNQALEEYRNTMGIPAKLIVVAMTANQYSVADPADAGQMDVVGFDTAVPNVISSFITGTLTDKKEAGVAATST